MRYETLRYLIFLCFPILSACEETEKLLCVAEGFSRFVSCCGCPTAENVHITGTLKDTELLTGHYTYRDQLGDREGTTTFRWLRGNDNNTIKPAIQGATNKTYTLTTADVGFWIVFQVTPHAQSGPSPGGKFQSNRVGPVRNK